MRAPAGAAGGLRPSPGRRAWPRPTREPPTRLTPAGFTHAGRLAHAVARHAAHCRAPGPGRGPALLHPGDHQADLRGAAGRRQHGHERRGRHGDGCARDVSRSRGPLRCHWLRAWKAGTPAHVRTARPACRPQRRRGSPAPQPPLRPAAQAGCRARWQRWRPAPSRSSRRAWSTAARVRAAARLASEGAGGRRRRRQCGCPPPLGGPHTCRPPAGLRCMGPLCSSHPPQTPLPPLPYRPPGAPVYRGTLHALGALWRAEGLRGMYAGLGPTALSQAPFSALYYMFYTRLQVGCCCCCRCCCRCCCCCCCCCRLASIPLALPLPPPSTACSTPACRSVRILVACVSDFGRPCARLQPRLSAATPR